MSRIRRSDTKPELLLRRRLWADGLRYRVDYRTPGGRADLVFPGPRVAVFVDGCFWHGCPDHYVRPRSREMFWADKLRTNVERDRRQTLKLEAEGWTVLRFWEHEVFAELESVVRTVQDAVRGRSVPGEPRWQVISVVPVQGEVGDLEVRREEQLRRAACARIVKQQRTTRKW